MTALLAGCVRGSWGAGDGAGLADAGAPRDALAESIAGALPVVTAFSVTSATGTTSFAAGDPVQITWTVEDAEGLAAAPVELALSTDGYTWQTVVERFGSLSGSPKQWSGSYAGLRAPGAGFFRLRIVAWDAGGQGSVPVLSDALNAGGWSVFAGSADHGLGSSGRAALLRYGSNPSHTFAVSPTTGDLFAIDDGTGLVRLDARTGLTSQVVRVDTTNLPDDGRLPSSPAVGQLFSVAVDRKGRLYVGDAVDYDRRRQVLYQIDLSAGRVRRYLGGGTVFDASATPATVASTWSPLAFDEDNSLYFLATCTPADWTDTSTVRLMKVTQAADGSPGAVSIVAGSCVKGPPPATGPVDAKSSPLGDEFWISSSGSIAVWNRGEAIYLGLYTMPVTKILKGQLYATAITLPIENAFIYDPQRDCLLAGDGGLREYRPVLTGPGGETGVARTGGATAAPGCDGEGVAAADACLLARKELHLAPDGALLFADGITENADVGYRIRSLDADGRIRTRMGTRSFVGEGLDRRVVRGQLAGLAYKPASAPNQAAFPAGLYLMDHGGPALLRVDAQGKLHTLWGSQIVEAPPVIYPSGTPIGPALSLGETYFGGDAWALAFDDQGLPWVRYNRVLASVDAAGKVVWRQEEVDGDWTDAPDGADPARYDVANYGTLTNLALAGQGAFLVGADSDAPPITIRYFDFASGKVTRLIGKLPNGSSPDSAAHGSVKGLSLSPWCYHDCFLVYRADQDRLYFSEMEQLRYITAPTDPQSSTLGTVFASDDRIQSFAFSLDGKKVFYVKGGLLLCHDLGSGKSWCNDAPLGPPPELGSVLPVPNQLAVEDAGHLLLSNGRGEVLRYTLPP